MKPFKYIYKPTSHLKSNVTWNQNKPYPLYTHSFIHPNSSPWPASRQYFLPYSRLENRSRIYPTSTKKPKLHSKTKKTTSIFSKEKI